jgi:release factor glutamine methyltransferase
MSETVASLLRQAAQRLSRRGVATPALDARLLLQQVAGLSHADIVAEPDVGLVGETVTAFWHLVERRAAFEPVARILGRREFYGRDFEVTPDVLDPRPDTETLVTAALNFARTRPGCRILDLGTGSGAIALTLLAELTEATAVATDQSAAALAVAARNAETLGVAARLHLRQANWFEGVEGQFDLILSNPPYIASPEIAGLAPDVRDYDPLVALDGGSDGLSAYRFIAAGAPAHLRPGGRVMVEIGAGQESAVAALFDDAGLMPTVVFPDLGGHMRCLCFAARELAGVAT